MFSHKNEAVTHATTWMNLENIILSEWSQTQSPRTSIDRKWVSGHARVSRGGAANAAKSVLGFLWDDENVLQLDSDDDCTLR